jgi:plastocyanin
MRRTRTATFASALFALTIVLAACSSDSGSSSAPADNGGDTGGGGETVSMASTKFTPSSLTVQAGTTVTFTDTSGHTVTEGTDGQPVDDPIVDEQGGSDIDVTFDEPGTYNITCKIHPSMNMTITVEG